MFLKAEITNKYMNVHPDVSVMQCIPLGNVNSNIVLAYDFIIVQESKNLGTKTG